MTDTIRARIQLDGRPVDAIVRPDGTLLADGVELAQDAVRFLPPSEPKKIIGVGLNYRDHAEETGQPIPQIPLLFLKPTSSIAAHGDDVLRPAIQRLDYEGELAFVIGRGGRNIAEEDALDHIAGLTIANDVSARDFQRMDTQWLQAKGYDTFSPVGPYLVETTEWSGRGIQTLVNGEVVQSSNTDQLIFGVPTLVSYLSSFLTLEPGDVVLTGTPGGIGPVVAGDVVEVVIDGLGTLRNAIVDA